MPGGEALIFWDRNGGIRNMLGMNPLRYVARLVILVCLVTLTLPNSVNAAEAVVTDVRVGPQARATRVVFELDNQIPYSVFSLSNPYRVVIDMPEVGWRLPPRPLPVRTGVFETLRYGLYKPGNSRVVVDLRQPAIVKKTFIMAPSGTHGYRLVVDLVSASKTVFTRHQKKGPVKVTKLGSTSFPKPKAPRTVLPVAGAPQKKPVVMPVVTVQKRNQLPQQVIASPESGNVQNASFQLAPRKPAIRPQREKRIVVVDAGHGGPDPGTIGNSGIYEKHITLAMARELKEQLEAGGRYKVILTRRRDIFIRLRDRVKKGRDAGADLFISLHADSIKNRKISGPSIYTLSENASDKEAAALASKENKSDLIAGIDLTNKDREVTNILIDLAQRESMNQSAVFASQLIKSLKRQVKVLRNTHRFAGFAVLKAPDVPSVLVEMGFLSNPTDERNLRSRSYRNKFAAAMKKGIDKYFSRVEEARSR
jgi:N-acetylmuramoyl-L-alanine amidase